MTQAKGIKPPLKRTLAPKIGGTQTVSEAKEKSKVKPNTQQVTDNVNEETSYSSKD